MKKVLLTLLFLQLSIFFMFMHAQAAEPTAFSNWAKTAKLGGAALFTGMTELEMDQVLSDLVAQKVTVIEADSDLSNYLTDAQFEQELALMRIFSTEAHKRGLRVVWYYPSLEVVTVNGKNIDQTMAKEHPDWVQMGLDGTPNVFYGGSGQVFWVEKNDESAWMSPSSQGYRNFFMERVRKIVTTGIDGLWVDVPIYADFGPTKWSDFNPEAIAKFEEDSGYTIPTVEDWDDPAWRRWIAWRHEEIALFLSDITVLARSIDAEFPIFAETLPTDYNGATIYGLDGSYLKHIEGLTHIWEVDTMSNNVGMRNAREDDWISFISAFKYTRAASGKKPSWVFNYGKQLDDAELVMAEALATGNNPYELQVPEMTTTVGADFRTRMFEWAQINAPYLFEAQTGAEVAVLYSSPSRDYVDKFQGLGMFATWESGGDSLWWAGDPIESAHQRQYLAEFRGMVKLLVHEHVPFDTVVNPADWLELSSYETVILPDVEAISHAEADILRQYVENGGHLIITGPDPTGLNEFGTVLSDYALADLLGFSKIDPLPAEAQNIYGAGSVLFYSSLLGKSYFVSNDATALEILTAAIQATSTVSVTTDADRRVHFELSHLGDETVLQFVNFIGVDGTFSVVPTTFSVSLDVPAGKQVTEVALTSPDLPNTPALEPIFYTVSEQQVSFNMTLDQYALVVVSFNGAQTPQSNHTPIASRDEFNTNVNKPFEFTDAMLLVNDGDLDGDALAVTAIDSDNQVGSLVNHGDGSYTYTPLQDIIDTETLTYTISDSNGGTDTGLINIAVAPPVSIYYPETVTVTKGTYDWGTMASLVFVDEDTYDINSAAVSGGRACDWSAETTILESGDNIAQIKVTHIGQYTKVGVSQDLYVYNFQNDVFELVNSSVVGNEDDLPVSWVIDSEIADYISAEGKLRVRVRGFKSTGLTSYSNALYWEVSQAAPTGSNTAPTTEGQTLSTPKNTPVDITLAATDQNGDALTYSVQNQPAHGTLFGNAPNLQYTPNQDYAGSDSFTFKANDGQLDSNVATVGITVTSVNDAPTAEGQTLSTPENTPVDITLTATDQNGDALTYSVQSGPTHGTLSGNAPNLQYTPNQDYAGSDSFTFKANDGQLDSNVATVGITVTSVNDAPTAGGQTLSTPENSPVNITLTATDQNGDALTYSVQSGPAHGTLSGNAPNLQYTPNQDYAGNDSFTFKANDGQLDSNVATVGITVSSVNDAPTVEGQTLSTPENTPVDITLAATDQNGDALTYAVVIQPANGTLTGSAPNLVYTPNVSYSGSDFFTFKANDGQVDSGTATVNITVTLVMDQPVEATYYPEAVIITTGVYDWGTLTSFVSADSDTYDINSAAASGGRATDWYAETTISESPDNVTHIKVTHIGQYSKAGVSQEFYVYNFQDNSWELVNSSVVGNEDDVHISYSIDSEIAKYISSEGKLRARVRGFKSVSGLWSWSNALHWEISGVATGTNTGPFASFASICTNLDCVFTDQSTDSDGAVTARSWDFGDGSSSSTQNPNHTYTSAGIYTVSLTVTDNDGVSASVSHEVKVTASTDQPLEAVFVSIAAEDGWVRESNESSNIGGRNASGSSGSKAIRFGDDSSKRQYKSILSFDTSTIPGNAVILSAQLKLTRGGNRGGNPFTTHGTAYVDIKHGSFGDNPSLQNSDFQASADVDQVGIITNQGGSGTMYVVSLDVLAFNQVNPTGRTQFRLYFSIDDDNDGGNDYAGFYPANNSNAARHPRLIVTYQK